MGLSADQHLTAANASLRRAGLPSYDDVVKALHDVLDGTANHDLPAQTGLAQADIDHLVKVRAATQDMWLKTLG